MPNNNQASFPCTSCGLCCRHIGHIKQLVDYDRGDGVCKHFDENQTTCKIYEDRPLVCQVDEMYEKAYRHQFKNKLAFYKANAEVCNALQKQYGLDESLRVKL